MFVAKSKEMNFTHCHQCKVLPDKILMGKRGNTIKNGPFEHGTWKRRLHSIWTLVCSLKSNQRGCRRGSLVCITCFQERAASGLPLVPRANLNHPDPHPALCFSAFLPSFPYSSADDSHHPTVLHRDCSLL